MSQHQVVFDSDVIAYEDELREYAEIYAETYRGNFSLMIDAQRMLRETGSLPKAAIRPVLNTLRHDMSHTDLWDEVMDLVTRPGKPDLRVVQANRSTRERSTQQRKKIVQKPQRPVMLDLPALIKAPYAMSRPSGKAKRVIHLALPQGFCRWRRPKLPAFSHRAYWDYDMSAPFEVEGLYVATVCHPTYHGNIFNPVLLWNKPDDRDWCAGCERVLREAGF